MKLCVLPGLVLALSLVGYASFGPAPVDVRSSLLLAAEASDSGHSAGDRSHSRLVKLKRGVDWHCQT